LAIATGAIADIHNVLNQIYHIHLPTTT